MASMNDKEFYHLTVSVNKALNPMETPLKIKHARSAIIITHQTKETKSFWVVVTRQPLMENRFTAWKFCHLLHKILREGHASALKHSQTHKKMILEMGKLWGHLEDGVGHCIQAYSKLIVTKLDFHEKNTIFPGTLLLDFGGIEKFAGEDINVYFQLCVEIFDYLDDIVNVQSSVFASINSYRMSSMTPQGQCRLAPLITLIQDSNALYDLCVRVMFKLHDKLPTDILTGHRDRFEGLFSKIKFFYDNVRPLQYFADLIQVPLLPDSAPNFTSKIDFGSYIPPVVYVPQESDLSVDDNLIDTSIMQEQSVTACSYTEIDEKIELQNTVLIKEHIIQDLQSEFQSLKEAVNSKENNYKKEIIHLRNEVSALNHHLNSSKEMCAHMQSLKDDLQLQLEKTPALTQKATEEEEKAKTSEEKFAKLKNMYSQIRDEHINLLRQNGESTKLLNQEKKINSELISEVQELKKQISGFEETLKTKEIMCNQKSELDSKLQAILEEHTALIPVYEELKVKYEKLKNEQQIEFERLSSTEKNLQTNILELEQCKSKNNHLEQALNEANHSMTKQTNEYNILLQKYERDLESKTNEISNLGTLQKVQIQVNENQNNEIQTLRSFLETRTKEYDTQLSKLQEEKTLAKNETENLLQQNLNLESKISEIAQEKNLEIAAKDDAEKRYKNIITSILSCIFETLQNLLASKLNESNQEPLGKTLILLEEMETLLNKLNVNYQTYWKNENSAEDLVQNSILLVFCFSVMHEQCEVISNASTEITKGQDILDHDNILRESLFNVFQLFNNNEGAEQSEILFSTMNSKLHEMRTLIDQLMERRKHNVELGDLVEKELEEMDKVIKEAASRFVELLANSRSKDNGVKLEVNEKILDACTRLMECIKLLIKKSKTLQEEIVSTGRGNTSKKEFYKRNSQWTEGLISASKSVAKGANLLMEAANKAIISESNQNFEIAVAAQEIAACTAQLVVASKVKAPRESQKLLELTRASRSVSQATGEVVATVKDCNQHLEQSYEIDLTKLTSSQAKTMEIEIHVKVLELEQALQLERLKLSSFRKKYYQSIDD